MTNFLEVTNFSPTNNFTLLKLTPGFFFTDLVIEACKNIKGFIIVVVRVGKL